MMMEKSPIHKTAVCVFFILASNKIPPRNTAPNGSFPFLKLILFISDEGIYNPDELCMRKII